MGNEYELFVRQAGENMYLRPVDIKRMRDVQREISFGSLGYENKITGKIVR